MKLKILAHHTYLSPLIRGFVQRQITFALGRLAHRITRVTVRFEDVNGPKGGTDQSCRIEAILIPSGEVTACATEIDAETALRRASARIARRVKTEFARRRTRRRALRYQELQRIDV